jgi:uncharacterized protein (DUF302 family)
MLQVASEVGMEAVEGALRRAAHRQEASVLAVTHAGEHLREAGSAEDAFVFSVCAPELYESLLGAEIRMSAFLPCRISAYTKAGKVVLEAVSPLDFCRLLNRADLAPLAAPLEALLSRIMEDAAKPAEISAQTAARTQRGALGATEEQMNIRGSIPQRIDCKGTKVEELGGTGQHDAQGG